MNKKELIELATSMEIEANESMTNKQIEDLINAKKNELNEEPIEDVDVDPEPTKQEEAKGKEYEIHAPNKEYSGITASVGFVNGVGRTNDDYLVEWFKEKGYKVKEV